MVTPNGSDTTQDILCESCVITILPSANNKLYYYEGSEKGAEYSTTDYTASGLRTLLSRKKNETEARGKEAVLIIETRQSFIF